MLELTGIASVLRGISILYWILAAGTVLLVLWKAKSRRRKAIGALVVVCIFSYLPALRLIEASKREAYARDAWAHFRTLCDEKSGEKIYKTFAGVKSVLVIKPLPPATETDLYDQFWYGDPYSNATPHAERAKSAALVLADPVGPIAIDRTGRGFEFVESAASATGGAILKFYYPEGARRGVSESAAGTVSRFGISWEDISKPEDRKYWVAGSRLRVIDLTDKSVIAERVGFLIEAGFGSTAGQRRPWLASRGPNTTCPAVHTYSDRWFILKVLKPASENRDGK